MSMKEKIKKSLNSSRLDDKVLGKIKAGTDCAQCCCTCSYAGQGGSSTVDNWWANREDGLKSPNCPI